MRKLALLFTALAALFAISALAVGWRNAVDILMIPAAIATAVIASKSATLFAGELGIAMKILAYGMAIVAISWLMDILGELFKEHASTFRIVHSVAMAISIIVLAIGFYMVYKVAVSFAEERIGHPEGPGK